MNRTLIAIVLIAVIAIVGVSAYLFYPRVELKIDNYQASLEDTIVSSGIKVPFVVDANFTITNTGNKDSTTMTLYVGQGSTNYPISQEPRTIQPLNAGESRVINIGGLGRGYPDLRLSYSGQSQTFHFGDEITLTSYG